MADAKRGPAGHSYDVDSAWRNGTWIWESVYEGTPWGEYYTQNALRHLRRALTTRPIRSVLDVGAGAGRFAIPLHNWGYSVTALDLDSRALGVLSAKQPGVKIVQGDFGQVALGPFDMVISIGTVKYLRSFERFLATCHETLNPQGVLFCEMLNSRSLRQVAKNALSRVRLNKSTGPHFPTQLVPDECRRVLSANGFQPVWMRGACLLVPGHASPNTRLFRLAGLVERALWLDRLPALNAQYYFAGIRT